MTLTTLEIGRIRAVESELMENQFRTGLVRMEKTIKEKMGLNEKAGSVQGYHQCKEPVNAAVKGVLQFLSTFSDLWIKPIHCLKLHTSVA